MRKLIVTSLLVMLLAVQIDGLVWSLVLGNPVIDMKDESTTDVNSESDSLEDVSDIEHPRNTKFKLSSLSVAGSRPTRQHHGQVNQIVDRYITYVKTLTQVD